MARMTGGEAIIDSLIRHGIDTMFGLPGVQTYGLFDALARNAAGEPLEDHHWQANVSHSQTARLDTRPHQRQPNDTVSRPGLAELANGKSGRWGCRRSEPDNSIPLVA